MTILLRVDVQEDPSRNGLTRLLNKRIYVDVELVELVLAFGSILRIREH